MSYRYSEETMIISSFDRTHNHAVVRKGIRQIRANRWPVGILILTSYDDDPYITAVLKAGANGYVMKTASPDEIIEVDREIEILAEVARGFTNKVLGVNMSISDRTVQGHIARIFEKLHANSRTEAVMRAISLGLLEAPEPI